MEIEPVSRKFFERMELVLERAVRSPDTLRTLSRVLFRVSSVAPAHSRKRPSSKL